MKTFTAREYLKIDIANSYGHDKETWDFRINWFDKNEENLLNLVQEAKDSALFYAGINAWNDVKQGKPIGYGVSLDATASGAQLLACLTGDRKAAQLCNVVNFNDENGEPVRRDMYTVIYHKMLEVLGESSRIKRSDTKAAIMTAFYGSEAKPKEVFGEGIMLKTFENIMSTEAAGPWELNKFFLQCGNPNANRYVWVLPDNFHAVIKVMVPEVQTVNFLGKPFDITRMVQGTEEKTRMLSANTIHSVDGMVVREMLRRCNFNPETIKNVVRLCNGTKCVPATTENASQTTILWNHYIESGFLSTRIFDYLDDESINLVDVNVIKETIDTMPKKPFPVMTVHDCFRVLPCYGNDLRRQYNQILSDIARSNLLSYLLSQILGQEISVGKLDNDLWKDILETEYALS